MIVKTARQKEVAAAVKSASRKEVFFNEAKNPGLEYATNTLLGGRGRGLMSSSAFLYSCASSPRKGLRAAFPSIELRCGGFLGCATQKNHHEQEEKKYQRISLFHYSTTRN